MRAYLEERHAAAREAEARLAAENDALYTPMWRDTGVPVKPSPLDVDPEKLASAALLNPKAIVAAVQNRTNREMQPPQFPEFMEPAADFHYLTETTSYARYKELASQQMSKSKLRAKLDASIAATTKQAKGEGTTDKMPVGTGTLYGLTKQTPWAALSADEVERKMAESEARRKAISRKMSADQMEEEMKVLERMSRSQFYRRNPRMVPEAQAPPKRETVLHQETSTVHMNPITKRPMAPEASSASEKLRTIIKTKAERGNSLRAALAAQPASGFVLEPETLAFHEYHANGVFEAEVQVRNVAGVMRRMRVLPPVTQYFSVTDVMYPTDHVGVVAPGLSATVRVAFAPDSLADYEDEVQIVTDAGKVTLKLRGLRPAPSLTLPKEFDIGPTVVNKWRVKQFHFQNLGGESRFRLIPNKVAVAHNKGLVLPGADLPLGAETSEITLEDGSRLDLSLASETNFSSEALLANFSEITAAAHTDLPEALQGLSLDTPAMRCGNFVVWPTMMDLAPGEERDLFVAFKSDTVGKVRQKFKMVSDNCVVRTFVATAFATELNVGLTSVDDRESDAQELVHGETKLSTLQDLLHPDLDAWRRGQEALAATQRATREEEARARAARPGATLSLSTTLHQNPLLAHVPPAMDPSRGGGITTVDVGSDLSLSLGPATSTALLEASEVSHVVQDPAEPAPSAYPVPDQDLWFGHVSPGHEHVRILRVHNPSPLPVPFEWILKGLPSVSDRHASLQATALRAKTMRDASIPEAEGLGATGLDGLEDGSRVPAAEDMTSAYTVEPAHGMLAPEFVTEFTVTFAPGARAEYRSLLALSIDTSTLGTCGVDQTMAYHTLAEQQEEPEPHVVTALALLGMGAPVEVTFSPAILVAPSPLTPGQIWDFRGELRNHSLAPAHWSAACEDHWVSLKRLETSTEDDDDDDNNKDMEEQEGRHHDHDHDHDEILTLAPQSSIPVRVRLTTPPSFGEMHSQISLRVLHGSTRTVPISCVVDAPTVVLSDPGIMCGLIQTEVATTRTITLTNTSPHSRAVWRLALGQREDPPTDEARDEYVLSHTRPDGYVGEGRTFTFADSMHVEIDHPSGILAPSASVTLTVHVTALTEGSLRHALRLELAGAHRVTMFPVQCQSLRPKLRFSTPTVPMGVIFQRVPVQFEVTCTNVGPFPTKLTFDDEQVGAQEHVSVYTEPRVKYMRVNESTRIKIKVLPMRATPNVVVYMLARVEGCPKPLALKCTGDVRGLDMSYRVELRRFLPMREAGEYAKRVTADLTGALARDALTLTGLKVYGSSVNALGMTDTVRANFSRDLLALEAQMGLTRTGTLGGEMTSPSGTRPEDPAKLVAALAAAQHMGHVELAPSLVADDSLGTGEFVFLGRDHRLDKPVRFRITCRNTTGIPTRISVRIDNFSRHSPETTTGDWGFGEGEDGGAGDGDVNRAAKRHLALPVEGVDQDRTKVERGHTDDVEMSEMMATAARGGYTVPGRSLESRAKSGRYGAPLETPPHPPHLGGNLPGMTSEQRPLALGNIQSLPGGASRLAQGSSTMGMGGTGKTTRTLTGGGRGRVGTPGVPPSRGGASVALPAARDGLASRGPTPLGNRGAAFTLGPEPPRAGRRGVTFRSHLGQRLVKERDGADQHDDALVFDRGLSLEVDHRVIELEPHGVQVLEFTAHANMPGWYQVRRT